MDPAWRGLSLQHSEEHAEVSKWEILLPRSRSPDRHWHCLLSTVKFAAKTKLYTKKYNFILQMQ